MTIKLRSLALALGLAARNTAWAQAPIVIKFSHVVAPTRRKGRPPNASRMLAEKLTRGRVKVEVYPNSQLYKDKEELEALQLGAVQMLAPSLAKFGPLGVKEFEAFDLPYIFPTKAALYAVTEGQIGKRPAEEAGAEGHHRPGLLGQWLQGHVGQPPLHMPADFRGLRMRIQSSKVLDAQMRALGANGRRCWPSRKPTRRCRPAWSTAPRIRRRTCTPRRCTRCRST
jgi:C4-dicarboxylate-binding protein DctP